MNSKEDSLFKNKRERTAHLPKGSVDVKAKKIRLEDPCSEEGGGTTHISNKPRSAESNVVAFGDLRNGARVLSSEDSIDGIKVEEVGDSDPSHIKLKLKVGENNFYNLKPRSKPDELNEEILFARSLRRSVKFNDELKRQSQGARRSSKKAKVEAVKNPCFGRISKSSKTKWSFDTPAPEELVEIHRKNFNLDEESSLENDGPKFYRRPNGTMMDWDFFLNSDPNNLATVPPVTNFKWAPFADIWDEIAKPGLYIELRNPFLPGNKERYWFGSIVYFAGYRALVKFETFDSNPLNSHVAWISFCSDVPKPLGWCKKNNKELVPGPIIKGFKIKSLEKRMKEFGTRPTISPDHYTHLLKKIEQLQKHWNISVPVEAMDVHSLHQNRLARITAVVGDRVHLSFYTTEDDQDDYSAGYWFHYQSESLHPLFWSQTVGMVLNGVSKNFENFNFQLPPETFDSLPGDDKIAIKEGMKVETVHPYYTDKIVGAVVVKVLNYGYIEIQTREASTFSRLHCVHHIRSPYLLSWGFGSKHGVETDFKDDLDDGDEVDLNDFLNLDGFSPRPEHKFCIGDKVEAFELINSAYLGPTTVKQIAGHLLLLHFDSWPIGIPRNYQWVDAESTEIYPIGYAKMLGLKWQGGA